jgi:hypothetical protein
MNDAIAEKNAHFHATVFHCIGLANDPPVYEIIDFIHCIPAIRNLSDAKLVLKEGMLSCGLGW